jgi:hypothetical protein
MIFGTYNVYESGDDHIHFYIFSRLCRVFFIALIMLKYRFAEWKMTYVRGKQKWIQVKSNVAYPDPGSGNLLTPGSGIRDG